MEYMWIYQRVWPVTESYTMEDKTFNCISNEEVMYTKEAIRDHLNSLIFTNSPPPVTHTNARISSISFLIHSDDFQASSCF